MNHRNQPFEQKETDSTQRNWDMKIPNDRWTLTKRLVCREREFIEDSQKRWSFAKDSSSDHRRTVFGKS